MPTPPNGHGLQRPTGLTGEVLNDLEASVWQNPGFGAEHRWVRCKALLCRELRAGSPERGQEGAYVLRLLRSKVVVLQDQFARVIAPETEGAARVLRADAQRKDALEVSVAGGQHDRQLGPKARKAPLDVPRPLLNIREVTRGEHGRVTTLFV